MLEGGEVSTGLVEEGVRRLGYIYVRRKIVRGQGLHTVGATPPPTYSLDPTNRLQTTMITAELVLVKVRRSAQFINGLAGGIQELDSLPMLVLNTCRTYSWT